MKKIYPFIFVICNLLLALINAGSLSYKASIAAFSSASDDIQYSFSDTHFPQGDVEIRANHHSISGNGNHRHQSLMGDLGFVINSRNYPLAFDHYFSEDQSGFRLKQYLSHIYPSHNFW